MPVDSSRRQEASYTDSGDATTPRAHLLTVIAVAVVAHAATTLVHEGLGHGGACLFVGCRPRLLTTMQFDGDERNVSTA